MTEVAVHQVRDGARVLRFRGRVLGAATSQRGSAPRWSELSVYQLEDRSYLISKVGRSTVAHRPTCLRVNHRMVTWGSAQTEPTGDFYGPRSPCPDCRPDVTHLAASTRLEVPRYRAIVAANAENAARILTEDRTAFLVPQLVRDVLAQCAGSDPCFSAYADAVAALPKEPCEKTTSTP